MFFPAIVAAVAEEGAKQAKIKLKKKRKKSKKLNK